MSHPEETVLPCGCRYGGTRGGTLWMDPCSPRCPNWRYMVGELRRQGKPVSAVLDPEADIDVAEFGLSGVRHCPYCGHSVDCYHGADPKDLPKDGDVSLCLHCRRFAIFTEDGLRKPTWPELASIANDEGCRAALAAAAKHSRPGDVIVDWRGKRKPPRGRANSGGR